jgi:hypothetical protein
MNESTADKWKNIWISATGFVIIPAVLVILMTLILRYGKEATWGGPLFWAIAIALWAGPFLTLFWSDLETSLKESPTDATMSKTKSGVLIVASIAVCVVFAFLFIFITRGKGGSKSRSRD